MSKKIKSIKRFNQNYKNFSFSDLTNHADAEFIELNIKLDENGNTIEEEKFTSDGTLEEKNNYTYDSHNKLLTHVLLYAVDDVTEKRILTRNEKGYLQTEIKYYGDDSGEKTQYEYNEKENISAIIHYDEEGIFISREEIIYDESGSLTDRITYDADKKLVTKLSITTPEKSHLEEVEYDSKGEIVSKTHITFNESGKELFTKQTNPQGKLISSISNTYDERGNIIEKVYKDFYSKKILYQYNEKNLLVLQEMYDENGLLLRKNFFEYDDEGNVIAEQTYEMDTSRGGRDKHYGTRYEYEFY